MQFKSVITTPVNEVYFNEGMTLWEVNDALKKDGLRLNISKTLLKYGIKTAKPFGTYMDTTTLTNLVDGKLVFKD